jgi:hypothetical protein
MPDSTISTESLFLRLFCLIDDLYNLVAPDHVRHRPNAERLKMSDSEIITLSVMHGAETSPRASPMTPSSAFIASCSKTTTTCFPTSSAARDITVGVRT